MRISKKRRALFKFEKDIDEKQLFWAFVWWHHHCKHKQVDTDIKPFLPLKICSRRNWLRSVREAQFLSRTEVAKRMKITRAAIQQFERNETNGKITIETLAKAAEAMNCELVYAIRSKELKPFAEIIWNRLLEKSVNSPWVVNKPQFLKGRSLAAIAQINQEKPKFRREQGWTERKR